LEAARKYPTSLVSKSSDLIITISAYLLDSLDEYSWDENISFAPGLRRRRKKKIFFFQVFLNQIKKKNQ